MSVEPRTVRHAVFEFFSERLYGEPHPERSTRRSHITRSTSVCSRVPQIFLHVSTHKDVHTTRNVKISSARKISSFIFEKSSSLCSPEVNMGPGGEGWGLPLFLSVIKSGKIVQSNVKSGYVTLADMSKDRAVDATRLSLAARSLMNTARRAGNRAVAIPERCTARQC